MIPRDRSQSDLADDADGRAVSAPWWLPWAILLAAAGLRLLDVGTWSLWLDEETSIYFALNPDKPFPSSFPLYFWTLGSLFEAVGVSVLAARVLTALIGIGTLWLLYRTARRFCGDEVAIPALALLSVSVGHLFWSQSIRYYVLVLAFQLLSIHAFLAAVDRPRVRSWIAAGVWFLLALVSHLTAVLLLPVYAAFLGFLALRRAHSRAWMATGLLVGAFAALSAVLAAGWFAYFPVNVIERTPVAALNLTVRFVVYTGVPAVGLAILPFAIGRSGNARFVFFALLSVIPVVELIAIRALGLWFAVWYHALIASSGVAVLGGYGWRSFARRVPRWTSVATGAVLAAMSVALLFVYYTQAHGDRPRWREAVHAVTEHAVTVPVESYTVTGHAEGVIAFYLGVPPSETMGSSAVRPWRGRGGVGDSPTYVIVREDDLLSDDRSWLQSTCSEVGRFPSRMIVRDRTVVAFYCAGR